MSSPPPAAPADVAAPAAVAVPSAPRRAARSHSPAPDSPADGTGDLTRAVQASRHQLWRLPEGAAERVAQHVHLGVLLLRQFGQSGAVADLDEAEEHCRWALAQVGANEPRHLPYVIEVVRVLTARGALAGDPSALAEARHLAQQTLSTAALDAGHRHELLTALDGGCATAG